MNILFRADSSSIIGTGHIMRDLVLAKQYTMSDITFATIELDGNINHKIKEAGYRIELLKANDFNELDDLIKKLDIDMLIIDHYGIEYEFEKKLKEDNPNLNFFVFDDTYEKHYCDILLNHNIYADRTKYKGLVPENCELRCGSKFTLLRDEFIKEKQNNKKLTTDSSINNVFIAMGGTDYSNINIKILQVLESFSNLHTHVVTTTANAHLDELKEYAKGKQNITLYINTDQIAKLMHESDFAIVTPSVTLNEVFYMELPFIAIQTADNQKEMVEFLKKNKFDVLEKWEVLEFQDLIKGRM